MKHPGFNYTSPTEFTPKQRLALAVSPFTIGLCFKALAKSCRLEYRNLDLFERALHDHKKVIIAIWHETLGLGAYRYRNSGIHTLTSFSFDGELAARFVEQFGMAALRGSSSRGGLRALVDLKRILALETIGLTIDGPKGPRREAKPGAAILAARTGVPIVPNAYAVSSGWRMNSWDRLMIPKPFSNIVCVYGAPILPADDSPESIEAARVKLEEALNELHAQIDES